MLILDKTRINILVDVNFLIPTFQVVLIHINKVGNRINKVGHETTKWVNESTKWVNESTSWTAPNQPGGSRQLYALKCVSLPNSTLHCPIHYLYLPWRRPDLPEIQLGLGQICVRLWANIWEYVCFLPV